MLYVFDRLKSFGNYFITNQTFIVEVNAFIVLYLPYHPLDIIPEIV